MGAVNRLHFEFENPTTRQVMKYVVQFKYGDTWETSYKLGDTLAWGGNDKGRTGKTEGGRPRRCRVWWGYRRIS
jgi:hypothetical protein